MYNCARHEPQKLFIGIDANRRPLQKLSERIYRRPAKGGLPNVLFLQAAVEALPSELDGIASEVHVNFPWGSLLRGVAGGNKSVLGSLRRVCAPNAFLKVIVGLDPVRDRAEIERLQLPNLSLAYLDTTLASYYRNAGLQIVGREIGGFDVLKPETTWAKRLKSSPNRSVIRLLARAMQNRSAQNQPKALLPLAKD